MTKTSFFCNQCGYESPKWMGKCPGCLTWNSFIQAPTTEKESQSILQPEQKPRTLAQIDGGKDIRLMTVDKELNRVLGGGIVPGSLVLIGGEPGIGKSTLMLQVALQLSPLKILYVSGEESDQQIKMRATRLSTKKFPDTFFLLTETKTDRLIEQARQLRPSVLIIDSIQTLKSSKQESPAGSLSQVRQSTAELIKFAKQTHTAVLLIGHITKDGTLAGPKVLEHMVDTVLQFEGDRYLVYRLLRTLKNRFGSTNEIGIYEMQNQGLRQVPDPDKMLISQKDTLLSGVTIGSTLEGTRSLLVEIQALVSRASYGTPQRTTTGFDYKRMSILLAILEKRYKYRMATQDVFLNIAGGIKVEDPAIDLAVAVALISSLEEKPVSDKVCFAAEIGLGGELRAINRIDQRVAEANRLGYHTMYISKFNKPQKIDSSRMTIFYAGEIKEVIQHLYAE